MTLCVGNVYGRWTVKAPTDSHKYLCACECGTEREVCGYSLEGGRTESCGCLKIERIRKVSGGLSYNIKYNEYKIGSIKRGIDFSISMDLFVELTAKNCFYCGAEPKPFNPYYDKNGILRSNLSGTSIEGTDRQWINFNGIDRVDNDKGYVVENCVSCCSVCNVLKHTLDQKYFLDHVCKIYTHQKSGNNGKP